MLHDSDGSEPRRGPRKGSARRGFGRIRRLPSGRWQVGYTGLDQRLHNAPVTFLRKDDAVGWLNAERELLADPGAWIPPEEREAAYLAALAPTFSEYASGWLASRNLKPRTRAEYQRSLERDILPTLGPLRVDLITPGAVRQWYTAMGPNRPTSRAHAYQLLKSILRTAVDEQIIGVNPCVIRAGGAARTKHKAKPATLQELATITANMPERLRLAVLIAAWCGLRQGELLELRRRDIELTTDPNTGEDQGVIHVTRAVTRVKGKPPVVGTPKSAAGIRDVAIPPHLIPEVRRHLHDHVAFGREALLFTGRDSGEELRSSTLYRWFYPARKMAGREDLTWHDLRHTGATLAAATGATLAELMQRLGHSTVGAALRYQHAASDRDQVIAEALSQLAEPIPLTERRPREDGGKNRSTC